MIEFFEKLVGLMQFTSVVYLVFLALAVVVYFVLPGARTRAAWLLVLSSLFYLLLSPRWFWVLIAVTAFTYVIGRLIGARRDRRGDDPARPADKLVLAAGVVAVAGALVAFKYLGFIAEVGNGLLQVIPLPFSLPVVRLLLPIGISFWTFQTIAYLVDVYRGTAKPERNPFYYALAVMFFPVVTAGPITRIQTLVPQLRARHRFDYGGMQSGLLLIGWGFFKKLMVADRLGVFVNTVFDNPHDYSGTVNGLIFSVAAVFFAIQLYCDFSGYTDIVRGSARLFGVELPINFRAPYFARSVRDFWRRWHITLMDWLRDYVYIPLGGNRKGPVRRYANIMTVFLVSGIWHGAGLSFVVWGGLNGVYLIAGEAFAPVRDRLVKILRVDRATLGHRIFQTGLTFGLITFAWVFFRANSLADALYMVPRMFVPAVWIFGDGTMVAQGLSYSELMVAFVSIGVVWLGDWLSLRTDVLAGHPWTTYRGLPEGSVEVLFFGTSMIHANVNPVVIWETSGIRSYVLSGSAQSLVVTPWHLEEALKTQRPQVVVLDIRGLLNESYEQTELQKRVNYTMMPAGIPKLRAIREGASPQEWTRYWLPWEQFHSRWPEVSRQDFYPLKRQDRRADSFFGYRLVDRVELQEVSTSRKAFDAEVYDQNYAFVSQFIETASGAGAQVLLLISPTSQPDLCTECLPRLQSDIARDYPDVDLLSVQDYVDEIRLSYETHYYDAAHLNREGAEKYSSWLATGLRKSYALPTQSPDGCDSVWQSELERYEAAAVVGQEP